MVKIIDVRKNNLIHKHEDDNNNRKNHSFLPWRNFNVF